MAEATKSQAKPKKKAPAAASADAAAAPAEPAQACRAAKCKQAVRAKGYCRKHFIAWRRGEVGKKHRYKICSKEGCRKPRALGGLCDEHSGKGAAAAPAAG
jgi:hypothetical protein